MINCRREWEKEKLDISDVAGKLRLCENHFEASQFSNPGEKGVHKIRKRLNINAVPTIFCVPNPPKPINSGKKRLSRRDPNPPPASRKKQKLEQLKGM